MIELAAIMRPNVSTAENLKYLQRREIYATFQLLVY
jgi:hypothetical protein